MSIHIGAKKGDIAETVLLPGDPYRAKWAAETFLDDARCVNEVRGMLGFTGSYKGMPVTIHGSGMGMPSLSIYVNELIRDYGARRIIRIGSCGGMAADVKVNDIVIAMTSSAASSMNRMIFGEIEYAPCADWRLLRHAVEAAEARGLAPHVGGIISQDTFYTHPEYPLDTLIAHGVLAVEMETAALYTLAARLGARALTVLTVSDHLKTGEEMPAEQRERGFSAMVEMVLEAALADAG
ncbi:MAG: purine-nucleoside phosphorylase [Rhizobiaceae bacterium]